MLLLDGRVSLSKRFKRVWFVSKVWFALILVLIITIGIGAFYGRYNVVIISESRWDYLNRAEASIKAMEADAEREKNLEQLGDDRYYR